MDANDCNSTGDYKVLEFEDHVTCRLVVVCLNFAMNLRRLITISIGLLTANLFEKATELSVATVDYSSLTLT